MVEHNAIPKFGVVCELRMRCELYPIIFYHVLQSNVTGNWWESSASGKMRYGVPLNVVHSKSLKSQIFIWYVFEVISNLEKQQFSFKVLKREIIEFQKLEVSFDKPRILVWRKLLFGLLYIQESIDFVQKPWYVHRKEIDYFIDDISSRHEIPS